MKTKQPPVESREEIEDIASDLLQRRRFGTWGAAEEAELDTWLRSSEARRIAFWRLEAVLARVERLAALRAPKPKPRTRAIRLGFMMPFLAAAVSLGLLVTLGFAAERYFLQAPPDHTYSTNVGGHALLNFADRTQIELDTDTVVRYRMTNKERTVWLEKGAVWFHVSHDAAHPFTVVVGKHRVTDLGTEFLVRRDADGIPNGMEVALLSGRAALSTEGAQTAMLVPGDDAVATPVSLSVNRKTPQELADALAWRRGLLVFRNTRLADAVQEFNRYNTTKLVIADPSIADVKVSAEVRAENFEGFLRLAETVMDLRIDREGNDILISRAAEKTKRTARSRSSSEAVAHVMRGE